MHERSSESLMQRALDPAFAPGPQGWADVG